MEKDINDKRERAELSIRLWAMLRDTRDDMVRCDACGTKHIKGAMCAVYFNGDHGKV